MSAFASNRNIPSSTPSPAFPGRAPKDIAPEEHTLWWPAASPRPGLPASGLRAPGGALATAAPLGLTTLVAGSAGLRASGKVPPVTIKGGRPAYEVLYRRGQIHPSGTNANFTMAPAGLFPAEQCRMRFKLWVDDTFPWGPEMRKVGGKIIGFVIGQGDASGGKYSTTGATYRLTFSHGGGVGPYLYPQVRAAHATKTGGNNITWQQLDQSPEVQSIGSIAKGVHMFYPKDKRDPAAWDLKLHKGRWNDIEMFVKLNTPGRQDGVLSATINGVTKSVASVRYRYDGAKINAVHLGTFFGGSSRDYAPPQDTRAWYSDFTFSPA